MHNFLAIKFALSNNVLVNLNIDWKFSILSLILFALGLYLISALVLFIDWTPWQ